MLNLCIDLCLPERGDLQPHVNEFSPMHLKTSQPANDSIGFALNCLSASSAGAPATSAQSQLEIFPPIHCAQPVGGFHLSRNNLVANLDRVRAVTFAKRCCSKTISQLLCPEDLWNPSLFNCQFSGNNFTDHFSSHFGNTIFQFRRTSPEKLKSVRFIQSNKSAGSTIPEFVTNKQKLSCGNVMDEEFIHPISIWA